MLFDFILRIPYYLVRFFVPRSVWDGWLASFRELEAGIDRRKRDDGVPNNYVEHRKWENKNCTWRRSIRWKLIKKRWPLSI